MTSMTYTVNFKYKAAIYLNEEEKQIFSGGNHPLPLTLTTFPTPTPTPG